MLAQFPDNILTERRIVYYCHHCRSEFNIRDILSYISGDSAMYLDYMSGVPSSRDILRVGISFDIHESSPYKDYTGAFFLFQNNDRYDCRCRNE